MVFLPQVFWTSKLCQVLKLILLRENRGTKVICMYPPKGKQRLLNLFMVGQNVKHPLITLERPIMQGKTEGSRRGKLDMIQIDPLKSTAHVCKTSERLLTIRHSVGTLIHRVSINWKWSDCSKHRPSNLPRLAAQLQKYGYGPQSELQVAQLI